MVGCDEAAPSTLASSAPPAPVEMETTDRITLEIKGAKLNVAIQNALRRKCSHEDRSTAQGSDGSGNSGEVHQDTTSNSSSRSRSADGAQHRQGVNSSGTSGGRDVGSTREVDLLKAAVESLRAGLREKEDSVTELEREKEGLLEQVAGLESAAADNVKLGEKITELEGQIKGLEGKLRQAETGWALTMTLLDTLKSAQNDLRTAHGRVSQRYAELENMSEDSAEAIRRGNTLLHSQQLKIDAQSRQIKRHEEDLTTLREERELYLRKADQNEAELAQVMRRERSGQGVVADARAEVDELKEELSRMQKAFVRHRGVVRKNQEVIDAHEKALNDARSELLSLCLEAEKQSARHQKASADAASETSRATGEKNSALRELRTLRIEKEELNDRLEEAVRKFDQLQAQQQEQQQRLESAAKLAATTAIAGAGHPNAAPQPCASSEWHTSPSGTATAPDRPPPPASQARPGSLMAGACGHSSSSKNNERGGGRGGRTQRNSSSTQQQHFRSRSPSIPSGASIDRGDNSIPPGQDYRAAFQQHHLTAPARAAREALDRPPSSSSLGNPSGDAVERPAEIGASQEGASSPPYNAADNDTSSSPRSSFSPSPAIDALVARDRLAGGTTSTADAGGGGGGSGGGGGGGVVGRTVDHSNAGAGSAREDGGETRIVESRKDRPAFAAGPEYVGQEDDVLMPGDEATGGALSKEADGQGHKERGFGDSARAHGGGGSTGKGDPFSRRSRSRPRSPPGRAARSDYGPDDNDTDDLGEMRTAGASLQPSAVGSGRKRSKTAGATDHVAGGAGGDGSGGTSGFPSPPSLLMPSGSQHHFVHGSSSSGKAGVGVCGNGGAPDHEETAPGDDGEQEGTCPSCGDTPYGLMINCSGCSRQHHSSCVPEGRRVGKGLGSVFRCSKCSENGNC